MASSDTSTAVEINQTWKTILTICVLACNGSIIVWLILYGKADNSLHTSALGWSYLTVLGILAGLGFGAISGALPTLFEKK